MHRAAVRAIQFSRDSCENASRLYRIGAVWAARVYQSCVSVCACSCVCLCVCVCVLVRRPGPYGENFPLGETWRGGGGQLAPGLFYHPVSCSASGDLDQGNRHSYYCCDRLTAAPLAPAIGVKKLAGSRCVMPACHNFEEIYPKSRP